jgi:hypothetical protein
MKLKATVLAVVTLALVVSTAAAVAAPGKGKGARPDRTGERCKPRVQVILKGTLDTAASDAVTMTVLRANRHGRRFVGAEPVHVSLDEKTKIRRKGRAQVSDLVPGDRLMVHARVCKADVGAGAAPALLARVLKAWPARPAAAPVEQEQQDESETAPPPPPA